MRPEFAPTEGIKGIKFQYRKRYEVTCDVYAKGDFYYYGFRFNTASGMRSHATFCNILFKIDTHRFQYRKRYEVTCDIEAGRALYRSFACFNTASGMRSHATFVEPSFYTCGV